MAALSLMEAVTAAVLQAATLAGLAATLAFSAQLSREAWRVHADLASRRQVEALLESWLGGAGTPPAGVVRVARARRLRMEADLDGDGSIDGRSAEAVTLSIVLGESRDGSALRHAFGRQTMTLVDGLPADASFEYLAASGAAARAPGDVRLVRIPLPSDALLLALPAARPAPDR